MSVVKVSEIEEISPPKLSVIDAWVALARWQAGGSLKRTLPVDDAAFLRMRALLQHHFSPDRAATRVAETCQFDLLFLRLSDVRDARTREEVFYWDEAGFPHQIIGRNWKGGYRVLSFDGSVDAGPQNNARILSGRELRKTARGFFIFERERLEEDRYLSLLSAPPARWLSSSIGYLSRRMPIILIAAITTNVFSLGASFFALQVWDRVIPSRSIHTLTVLALGVLFAMSIEFIIRFLRGQIIDNASERIDRVMSQKVFDKLLRMRSDARPRSIGSLVSQVRDLDHFREIFGSSVLTALIDILFLFLFVGVVFIIGGPLVYPLLAGIAVTLGLLLLFQFPLTRLAKQTMEETSIKSGLLVEAAAYSDQIKGIGASENYRSTWAHVVAQTAATSHSQKMWRGLVTSTTQLVQQLSYVALIVIGAIGVLESQLTMGQVIACSILLNRAMAPLMQVAGIMSSLQSALAGKKGIDAFMSKPEDGDQAQANIAELAAPALHLNKVEYTYPGTQTPQLVLKSLDIPFGSKVALLGRVGSGKSTLLRVLAGISDVSRGTLRYSGINVTAIPTRQLQDLVSYVPQNPRLFRGTVRQNLALGYPQATAQEVLQALTVVNAEEWLLGTENGLDRTVSETGEGFSGGQIQSLALARALVRPSKIFLVDEPTANMDDSTERTFIQRLGEAMTGRTLIMATHRPAPLAICDRVIVLDRGQIVMDGPRDEVWAKLTNGSAQ